MKGVRTKVDMKLSRNDLYKIITAMGTVEKQSTQHKKLIVKMKKGYNTLVKEAIKRRQDGIVKPEPNVSNLQIWNL